MNVEQMRRDIKVAIVLHGPISAAGMTAVLLSRILDAFDAMERESWLLDYSTRIDKWTVFDGSKTIAVGDTLLDALLAAAETLKGADDENRD